MTARSEAALAAAQRNDAQRVAAVVQEDKAIERLQAMQLELSKLQVRSVYPAEVLKRLASAGGLWFPEE